MKKHAHYQIRLKQLFAEHEEAKTVEKRYNAIRYSLYEEYHDIMDLTSKDRMIEFLHDVMYVDRTLRKMTSDVEQEEKKILSQNWVLTNGYESGFNQKLKI